MHKNTPSSAIAVASLTTELMPAAAPPSVYGLPGTAVTVAPKEFRLLPLGRFRSTDGSGRPLNIPEGWRLDAADAARLVAQSAQRTSRRVIDYEHQSLRAADNGKPAPASGWFGRLEARADGLYAVDVEWTAQAAAMIASKEYRYISPVFAFDKKTGQVLSITHAALTNDPGLDGLTDLAADLAALRAAVAAGLAGPVLSVFTPNQPIQPIEERPMKELLQALGLAETATEAEALTALAALKNTQLTELAALKSAQPDPAQFVATATLSAVQGHLATANAELAALKAQALEAEVTGVIAAALTAGQLIPATEGWARELGKSDLAALKAFVAAAPVVMVPGSTQTAAAGVGAAAGNPATGAAVTATELAVMKALGLDAGQFALGKHTEQGV